MEDNPERNVGRSQPASESDFVPAARELVQTPVMTRSEMTTSMVLGSYVRESRSSTKKPETVSRPDVELPAEVLKHPLRHPLGEGLGPLDRKPLLK